LFAVSSFGDFVHRKIPIRGLGKQDGVSRTDTFKL
jgi:hypothetical protein